MASEEERGARGVKHPGSRSEFRALHLSAFVSPHHEPSRACYCRRRAHGGRHNQALIALARRHTDTPPDARGCHPAPRLNHASNLTQSPSKLDENQRGRQSQLPRLTEPVSLMDLASTRPTPRRLSPRPNATRTRVGATFARGPLCFSQAATAASLKDFLPICHPSPEGRQRGGRN